MHKKQNIFLSWWRLVDQQTVLAIFLLFGLSLLLVTTASRGIAHRTGLNESYFVIRQLVYFGCASVIIIGLSSLDSKAIKRIAIIGFFVSLCLLILVKFYGYEIKGAKRWVNIFGISLQPSEFIKPCFFVLNGWILSLNDEKFPSFIISFILYIFVAIFIIIQPDIGVLALISAVWGVQIFIAGIHIAFVFLVIFGGGLLTTAAYFIFPHVQQRIDSFFDSSQGYQITKSLEAFSNGGFYGKGPGEGTVKEVLPDAYTDFIFAVAGEEFGIILCLLINFVFAFIVIRGFLRIINKENMYVIFSATGLLAQFGFQAIINMGVTLNLLPTKGMTLPFISYGGSSILALAINAGMLLAFTKRSLKLNKYQIEINL